MFHVVGLNQGFWFPKTVVFSLNAENSKFLKRSEEHTPHSANTAECIAATVKTLLSFSLFPNDCFSLSLHHFITHFVFLLSLSCLSFCKPQFYSTIWAILLIFLVAFKGKAVNAIQQNFQLSSNSRSSNWSIHEPL